VRHNIKSDSQQYKKKEKAGKLNLDQVIFLEQFTVACQFFKCRLQFLMAGHIIYERSIFKGYSGLVK
jgi:hypothetical protein